MEWGRREAQVLTCGLTTSGRCGERAPESSGIPSLRCLGRGILGEPALAMSRHPLQNQYRRRHHTEPHAVQENTTSDSMSDLETSYPYTD
ncbi:hypothetical protein RRG08_008482 [Elysia crispata]|uniref:Uncharacterized protein n=1 Tax=Elysia crispata TaxID=231223 RepID=A0AAE0Z8A8_9GAST|nr:hypothetical protein RRG08_008482 [Elysia crispata]